MVVVFKPVTKMSSYGEEGDIPLVFVSIVCAKSENINVNGVPTAFGEITNIINLLKLKYSCR